MKHSESFSSSLCERAMLLAERELSAFINAVAVLHGLEESLLSAEDWLEESELMDCPAALEARVWRAITLAASARLANRLNVPPHYRAALRHSQN